MNKGFDRHANIAAVCAAAVPALLVIALVLVSSCTTATEQGSNDERIRRDVVAALESQSVSGITVDVKDGVVTLAGTPSDPAAFADVVTRLRAIAGVAQVVNQAATSPPPTTAPPPTEVPPAKEPSTPDEVLAARVKMALQSSPALAGAKVAVAVSGGVATLSGTVPSDAAKASAEKTASATKGIISVTNDLQVVAATVADVPDPTIQSEAAKAVEKAFPDLFLTLSVSKGTVTIRGAVENRAQILQVTDLLHNIKGVKNVDTHLLTVEGGESGERIGSPSGR